MARRELELRTERLILRPAEAKDAARAAELGHNWDVARMLGVVPFPQPAISVEGFFLIAEAHRALGRGGYVFAIDLPGEGLIGIAGAQPIGGRVVIGYWLGQPYWGRGYATEAVGALATFAEGLDAGPLEAIHYTDNPASGRVLAKNGFVYAGSAHQRFSLARADYVTALKMERARRAQAA